MYSLIDAARRLNVERRTVVDLALLNGVNIFRHPTNARAKAIDEAGFQTVKQALERAKLPAAASA